MLLVGTRNAHKITEIRSILDGLPLRVVGADTLPPGPPIAETGATFSQNARTKVLEYGRRAARLESPRRPRWVVADDSGLSVDALGGAPGVHSARYAGEEGDDALNIEKLLQALSGIPPEARTAHFACALACARVPDSPRGEPRVVIEVEGRCDGFIAAAPRGHSGFGYDPVFVPAGRDRTFAELGAETKNRISHRADALRQLRASLEPRSRLAGGDEGSSEDGSR